MADCLTPPGPGRGLTPDELYDNLRAWAERPVAKGGMGVEVHETDFAPPSEAEHLGGEQAVGLVAARGDHFVAVVDRTQAADERLRTLSHELSHVLMEFGRRPPTHGAVLDMTGQVEPRAYLAERLVDRALGVTASRPGDLAADTAAAQRYGLRPFVIACEIAQAAKGRPRPRPRPRIRDIGYY